LRWAEPAHGPAEPDPGEGLNDHDEPRHDPVLAVMAGKLEARREHCAALAGKSTLNRLELSRKEPTRYHKIAHDPSAIEALLIEVFRYSPNQPCRTGGAGKPLPKSSHRPAFSAQR
jgi:hypothetical protein